MTDFITHTKETAPESAKPILDAVQGKYGFIPNIVGKFAEAPGVLKAYMDIATAVSQGTLSAVEQQIVLIATSRVNGCEYCVAAHSTMSDMQNLPTDVINAVREDKPINDSKLEALRQFAKAVVSKQGWVCENTVNAFLAAGYTKAQVLEVVLAVTQKTLSNYANHILGTPIDQAFQSRTISLKEQYSTACKAS